MTERIDEVDYLRALACLFVVLIHTTADYIFLDTAGHLTKTAFLFVNRALTFAVPAFIFISGFVLAQRYLKRDFSYPLFLKKRLTHIIVPYFGWTLVYYLYFIQQNIYGFSLSFFLQSLFLGKMVYHLYFVVLIVQFYLLFGVFRGLFQRYSSHLLMLVFLVINILFMKYGYFQYADRFFLQYLSFFTFGIYFSLNYHSFKEKICYYRSKLALGYVLLSIILALQYYQITMLKRVSDGFLYNLSWLFFSSLAIAFFFSVAISLQNTKLTAVKKFLLKLSDASYLIYLSHPLMLMFAQKIISHDLIPSTTLHFLCTLVFVLGTVLPITFFYRAHNLKKAKE